MKRSIFFILVVFSISSFCTVVFATDDEITITTYYPAPFGDYTSITAVDIVTTAMAVGDTNGDGVVDDNDLPASGKGFYADKVGAKAMVIGDVTDDGNINHSDFTAPAIGGVSMQLGGNIRISGTPVHNNDVATVGYVSTAAGGGPGSWSCRVYTSGWVSYYDTNASVSCPANRNLITGGCHYSLAVDAQMISSVPINGANNTGGWFCLAGGNNRNHQAYAWCCK